MKELITVYTPTYNRKKLLSRVYNSLINQTCKNFIWMVVDDGSTDGTKDLIDEWIKETKDFRIDYFYKKNEGVHTARELAYQKCKTELIMSIDSDDWLDNNAIENIEKLWKRKGNNKYAGIISQSKYENGKIITTNFPQKEALTYQEFTYKYHCYGDKATILKTDIIKATEKAPVFEGEKLIGEGFKWIQIPNNTPFLLLEIPTEIKEYQKDGYTASAKVSMFNNLNGFRANYYQHIKYSKYLKPKIKAYIGYIACSIFLKDRNFIRKSQNPFMTILILPFGFMAFIYLLFRKKQLIGG